MKFFTFKKYNLTNKAWQFIFRLVWLNILTIYSSKKTKWVKVLGFGFTCKHVTNGFSFSERYGYRTFIVVNGYIIRLLIPTKISRLIRKLFA